MADRMTPRILIVDWARFQHYKNRTPPWIKLYRSLLDNMEWIALEDGPARLLIELWLLASETDEGSVSMHPARLAWRLRKHDASKVLAHLQALADKGFVELSSDLASMTLAECLQHASPEGEERGEGEGEERRKEETSLTKPSCLPPDTGRHEFSTYLKIDRNVILEVWHLGQETVTINGEEVGMGLELTIRRQLCLARGEETVSGALPFIRQAEPAIAADQPISLRLLEARPEVLNRCIGLWHKSTLGKEDVA